MNSLQGHLLVASRYLPDPNFQQTVVLMVQHNEMGALGVILNRPTGKTLKEVWERVSDLPCDRDQSILQGGPVGGPLIALHTQPLLADVEVMPGIYFSTDRDNLQKLVADTDENARFYVGYAGWGDGQLESEQETGSWLTAPASKEHVFFDPDTDLWKEASQQIGSSILQSSLKIKSVPDDPSLN